MTNWLALILRGCLALGWTTLLCLLLLQPEADPLLDLGIPEGENTLLRELAFGAVHLAAFAFTCSLWTWALVARIPSASQRARSGGNFACAGLLHRIGAKLYAPTVMRPGWISARTSPAS